MVVAGGRLRSSRGTRRPESPGPLGAPSSSEVEDDGDCHGPPWTGSTGSIRTVKAASTRWSSATATLEFRLPRRSVRLSAARRRTVGKPGR